MSRTDNGTFTRVDQTVVYNKFTYSWHNLALAYSIAIAASLFGVLVGLRALYINGVSHDTTFFTTMAATRNPELDDLLKGQCLGASPIPKELAHQKLQYGVVGFGMHTARDGKTVLEKAASTIADHDTEMTPKSIASSITHQGCETISGDVAKVEDESDGLMEPAILHACFGFVDQVTLWKKGQRVI